MKDTTSIARTTKRIGSLRYFIKHRGTSMHKPNTASAAQVRKWKQQLKEELALRDSLKKKQSSKASA